MNNYINNSKINIIKILITNLRSKISFDKNNSILIYRCQIFEINGPNKANINNVTQDTIAL